MLYCFSVSKLFSEFHRILQFFFWNHQIQGKFIFRSFRSRLFREYRMMSYHKYQWNSVGICPLWTLRKCQFFFCINIFVRLDIVVWALLQALGILNNGGNRFLAKRGWDLGSENCNGSLSIGQITLRVCFKNSCFQIEEYTQRESNHWAPYKW